MDTRIGGCAVTPVPDDIRGEEVFAFIVPNAEIDDAAALAASIVKTCAERLAYHKVPGYIAIVDELPLSSTRKLARGEIKTLAAEAVSANRAIDVRALKAKLRHA
jgi:acyl-coenzyme A synthetase/AMP-(fatty) acid ligase